MSFTQELTCRWSTSKWTPTKLLRGHLLHRSCYTGVQPTSRWSNCIWTLAISYFSSSSISVWRQGQPGGGLRMAKCGFCLSLGNPLRRSRVSDGVKCESSLPPATVCGDRVDAQTCGGKRFFSGHGQPSTEIAQIGHPNMWQKAN